MPGDPVLEGVPETAEALAGEVLQWIQDTLEIDDRTTARLFGVDPPAIESGGAVLFRSRTSTSSAGCARWPRASTATRRP